MYTCDMYMCNTHARSDTRDVSHDACRGVLTALLHIIMTPVSAHIARRAAFRAALSIALIPNMPLMPKVLPAWAEAPPAMQLPVIRGAGWAVGVPPTYYRPRSRPKAGTFDDTVLVAADYAAGRTCSVSISDIATLLVDSGDPLPLQAGQIGSLRDIGKPKFVAQLLVGRRDNDPLGLVPPRSEIRDVIKVSEDTITFTVLTVTSTATSLTTAMPGARRTVARALFDPRSASLVTAWASSAVQGAACDVEECPPCGGLRCECPAPRCSMPAGTADDPLDLAIIDSLSLV